jgi:hypothetical protein
MLIPVLAILFAQFTSSKPFHTPAVQSLPSHTSNPPHPLTTISFFSAFRRPWSTSLISNVPEQQTVTLTVNRVVLGGGNTTPPTTTAVVEEEVDTLWQAPREFEDYAHLAEHNGHHHYYHYVDHFMAL